MQRKDFTGCFLNGGDGACDDVYKLLCLIKTIIYMIFLFYMNYSYVFFCKFVYHFICYFTKKL